MEDKTLLKDFNADFEKYVMQPDNPYKEVLKNFLKNNNLKDCYFELGHSGFLMVNKEDKERFFQAFCDNADDDYGMQIDDVFKESMLDDYLFFTSDGHFPESIIGNYLKPNHGEDFLNTFVKQYDESQLNQTKIKVLDDKQIEDVIKEIDAKPIDSAENVVATVFTKDGEYDVFYRNKDSDKFFDVCKVNKEYGDYDAIDGAKFTNLTTSGLEEIKEFISNRENLENTQEKTEVQKTKTNRQR